VIDVMNVGDGSVYPILDAMHIHPTLPEVVQNAFHNLRRLDRGRRTSETV
jgi:hypothetical protein